MTYFMHDEKVMSEDDFKNHEVYAQFIARLSQLGIDLKAWCYNVAYTGVSQLSPRQPYFEGRFHSTDDDFGDLRLMVSFIFPDDGAGWQLAEVEIYNIKKPF